MTHAKLREAAEKCTTGDPWYKEGDLCGRQTFGQFLPQDRAFIALANPAAVLALLDEIAALDQYGRKSAGDAALHRKELEEVQFEAAINQAQKESLLAQLEAAEGLNTRDAATITRLEAELSAARDKCEGLAADLMSAVDVAFKRGAHEWASLNYPGWIEWLKANEAARQAAITGGE